MKERKREFCIRRIVTFTLGNEVLRRMRVKRISKLPQTAKSR